MITLYFTILVVLIVMAGTIWIITNLNYNMMPEMEGMSGHH
jgi:heme/copper-type cytochrome/quinol oxidase subunit 4